MKRVLIAAGTDITSVIIAAMPDALVNVAPDGARATLKVRSQQYDLVIVDTTIRAPFLLLDTLSTYARSRRPTVVVLQDSPGDRVVIDPELVTLTLPRDRWSVARIRALLAPQRDATATARLSPCTTA
jgi:hypothetical protein